MHVNVYRLRSRTHTFYNIAIRFNVELSNARVYKYIQKQSIYGLNENYGYTLDKTQNSM